MGSVNKVILVGTLGRDPEIRTFPSGSQYCILSVATNDRWKDRDTGENRERTEWHRVVIYAEGLVRVAEQYLRKGQTAYFEGQLETRKWQDQSGQDRYSTEVAIRFRGHMQMLGQREQNSDFRRNEESGFSSPYNSGSPEQADNEAYDDDTPF